MFKKGEIVFLDIELSTIHKHQKNGIIVDSDFPSGKNELYNTVPQRMLLISNSDVRGFDMIGFNLDLHQIVSIKEFHLYAKSRVKRIAASYPKMDQVWEFDMHFLSEWLQNQVKDVFIEYEKDTDNFYITNGKVNIEFRDILNLNLEIKLPSEMKFNPTNKDGFSPEFFEKIKTSPLANNIWQSLMHGCNKYSIIEQLINIIENQQNAVTELIKNQPKKYTVVTEEMYKTLQDLLNQENG